MNFIYTLLGAAQLVVMGAPAIAQTSAPLPAPTQTIALSTHEAMCGAVQLANRRTVIFVADLEKSQIRMQCLAPDGTTAWQTNVVRMQQLARRENFDFTSLMADLGSDNSKRVQAKEALEIAARLKPMEVFTSGSNLFTT
ncbi:MAG TPA: hypothetical protein VF690_07640, partial [Hymenobacter sp.]